MDPSEVTIVHPVSKAILVGDKGHTKILHRSLSSK